MGYIRRTPTSYKDYTAIWTYIAERGAIAAADELLRKFDESLRLLSNFPKAGQDRSDLRPGLRTFPVGNYLLIYRPKRGGIELVRVVHGARDIRRLFRKP